MIPGAEPGGRDATLAEILDRREERAREQRRLLTSGGQCLVSFCMNIPGARKRFPLASAGFEEGLAQLRRTLDPMLVLAERRYRLVTGEEALLLMDAPAMAVKEKTVALEQAHSLGRLWDMDVLDAGGRPLSRMEMGYPPRACLVCLEPAKLCGRAGSHSPALVLRCVTERLEAFFRNRAANEIAACATRALLLEVSITPKPGLVDRRNSGSHRDMGFFTFLDSAAALTPFFREFFCLGWDCGEESHADLFARLRLAGVRAEGAMLAATRGVNTHKGLIFSTAILCGALGRLHAGREMPPARASVIEQCGALAVCALGDFSNAEEGTSGQQCFRAFRVAGIRGEAAAGFPSVLRHGLPVFQGWRAHGASVNDAGAATLVSLLAHVDDTNMIHRGGLREARRCQREAAALLPRLTAENLNENLTRLDLAYIEGNLSPGGCADLLALTLLFDLLETGDLLCAD